MTKLDLTWVVSQIRRPEQVVSRVRELQFCADACARAVYSNARDSALHIAAHWSAWLPPCQVGG